MHSLLLLQADTEQTPENNERDPDFPEPVAEEILKRNIPLD
jgi:hypothetical protein